MRERLKDLPAETVAGLIKKRVPVVYLAPKIELVAGKFVTSVDERTVRIMGVAEGYAMVRRPGAAPFVVSLKDLVTT